MKKILVIEDDPRIRDEVLTWLTWEDYDATGAADGAEGVELAQQRRPDLIICDIMMPKKDGYRVLLEVRALPATALIPFIFLTAKQEKDDIRYAMELGADDYITKPFDLSVLQAHIRAVLRRATTIQPKGTNDSIVVVGDLQIDPAQRVATMGRRHLQLSPKEFDLLLVLAQNVDRVLSLDELLTQVWGSTWVGEQQTLYVHVRWLREKIEEDPAHPCRLLTIRGIGYKFVNLQTSALSTGA